MNVLSRLSFLKHQFTSNQVIQLSSLLIVLIFNQSFWGSFFAVVEPFQFANLLFIVSVMLVMFTVTYLLLSLLSFRKTLKPVLSLVFILSSVTAYYMDSYGVVFDYHMIENVFQTDTHEAADLLDFSIILYVLLYGILPSVVIWSLNIHQYPVIKEVSNRAVGVLSVFIITSVSVYSSYKDYTFVFRENRQISFLINPVFPLRSAYRYATKKLASKQEFNPVFSDASREQRSEGKKKKLFIMVVGETARSDSFHISGYDRNTTPNIEKENIINFKNVSSCGTATAISVPCMFSHLKHDNFDGDQAENSANLLDALKQSGVNVLWRDNNSGCKGVCDRVESESMVHLQLSDLCNENGCFDEVLLNQLDEYVKTVNKDTYIVMHQQGSHGPAYYKRYPESFAVFKPDCRRAAVQNCTRDEVVNAYDNTILYTDYFLSKVISFLKEKETAFDTAMLYVSDHGESLGENGVYLHGLPYFMAPSEQTHVPFMLWMSDSFSIERNVDTVCLGAKTGDVLSHDNILHSVLGVMDVHANLYDKQYDIFSSCRHPVLSQN